MALTLILMRHAKSSWQDAGLDDHDRPLAARGRRAAPAMARWLAGAGHAPAEVLVSTARRAAGTWALMAPYLGPAVPVRHVPEIYEADVPALLELARGASASPVLLIGHNPAMADLAATLADSAPAHRRFAKFPTAAVAVIRFAGPDRAGIRPGGGRITAFVTPHDL